MPQLRCLAIQQLRAKPVQAGSNRSPGSRARAAPVRARGSHSFRSRGRRAPAGLPPFSVGAVLPGVSSARTSSVLLSRTLLPLLAGPRGRAAGGDCRPASSAACWNSELAWCSCPALEAREVGLWSSCPASQSLYIPAGHPRVSVFLPGRRHWEGLCIPVGHWRATASPWGIPRSLNPCQVSQIPGRMAPVPK